MKYTYKLPPRSEGETCGTPRNRMEASHAYVVELAVDWERITKEMLYYGAQPSRLRRFIKQQEEQ